MKEYLTRVIIKASPETVWTVLTDRTKYAEWNPEIIGIDGHMGPGTRIKAHVKLGDGTVRKVSQHVVTFESPTRMQWLGGIPLGLFTGRRTFTVAAHPLGAEFTMHLQMSGLMLSMILKSVGDRQPEIDSFSAALKQRAESRQHPQ